MIKKVYATITFLLQLALLVVLVFPTAASAAPWLREVINKSTAEGMSVLCRFSSAPVTPAAFTLKDPPRLVIDFKDSDTKLVPYKKDYSDLILKSIRVGRPEPTTVRVVLDLKYILPYKITPVAGTNDVLIYIPTKVEEREEKTEVLPGINYTYKQFMTEAGPMTAHVLDLDLNRPEIKLAVTIGDDRLGGKEKLSSLVKRKGAAIGINGGYFNMSSGAPIDMLVVRGKVLMLPDRYRGFFGLNFDGVPVMMRPNASLSIKVGDQHLQYVHRLNWPGGIGRLSIFTPEFGKTTGSAADRRAVIVRNGIVTGFSKGDTAIPIDGFVLTGGDSHKEFLDKIKKGDKAVVTLASYPDLKNIKYGFSAGPLLIHDSVIQDKLVEDFTISSGIVADRNPRTACGITNNNHIIFVVIEGRNTRSAGMTLNELAKFLLSLGSIQAINLDGGGSSEIVIGDKIINQLPGGTERGIANAVLIYHE